MNSPRFLFTAVGLTAAFTFVGPVWGQTTTLVRDTFTLTGTRAVGSWLNNTSPEVHTASGAWVQGGTGFVSGKFAAGGVIVAPDNGSIYTASVDSRISIPQPTTKITTVSADIIAGNNPNGGWQAVGFLSSATPPASNVWFGSTDAVLWVYIRPNGGWVVHTNGTTALLKSGTVSGFSPTRTYTLGLSYDPATGKARVFLRSGATETSLVSENGGWFMSGLPANSSMEAAGFHFNITKDVSSVDNLMTLDNFLVTATTAPIR
ncbi:MAG: hypothetical protein WC205_03085 [Opitutaceae bacterium]|jgi:hypothetical protein